MKTLLVKCTFEIPIEVEDNYYDEDFTPDFDIEENHCPGTGVVGAAFDEIYKRSDENSVCWACALKGKNEIIDYDYKHQTPKSAVKK
jgi:hypothetical protein